MQHARTQQTGMTYFASVLQSLFPASTVFAPALPLFYLTVLHHLTLCLTLPPLPVLTHTPLVHLQLSSCLDLHVPPRSFSHCVRLAHVNLLLPDFFKFCCVKSVLSISFFYFISSVFSVLSPHRSLVAPVAQPQ